MRRVVFAACSAEVFVLRQLALGEAEELFFVEFADDLLVDLDDFGVGDVAVDLDEVEVAQADVVVDVRFVHEVAVLELEAEAEREDFEDGVEEVEEEVHVEGEAGEFSDGFEAVVLGELAHEVDLRVDVGAEHAVLVVEELAELGDDHVDLAHQHLLVRRRRVGLVVQLALDDHQLAEEQLVLVVVQDVLGVQEHLLLQQAELGDLRAVEVWPEGFRVFFEEPRVLERSLNLGAEDDDLFEDASGEAAADDFEVAVEDEEDEEGLEVLVVAGADLELSDDLDEEGEGVFVSEEQTVLFVEEEVETGARDFLRVAFGLGFDRATGVEVFVSHGVDAGERGIPVGVDWFAARLGSSGLVFAEVPAGRVAVADGFVHGVSDFRVVETDEDVLERDETLQHLFRRLAHDDARGRGREEALECGELVVQQGEEERAADRTEAQDHVDGGADFLEQRTGVRAGEESLRGGREARDGRAADFGDEGGLEVLHEVLAAGLCVARVGGWGDRAFAGVLADFGEVGVSEEAVEVHADELGALFVELAEDVDDLEGDLVFGQEDAAHVDPALGEFAVALAGAGEERVLGSGGIFAGVSFEGEGGRHGFFREDAVSGVFFEVFGVDGVGHVLELVDHLVSLGVPETQLVQFLLT